MALSPERGSIDPEGYRDELRHGKFSLSEEEREKIRKEALAQGKDPEEAVRAAEQRMEEATARKREQQAEEARKELEDEAGRQLT